MLGVGFFLKGLSILELTLGVLTLKHNGDKLGESFEAFIRNFNTNLPSCVLNCDIQVVCKCQRHKIERS